MDVEVLRPDLEKALSYADGNKGGRPPLTPVRNICQRPPVLHALSQSWGIGPRV